MFYGLQSSPTLQGYLVDILLQRGAEIEQRGAEGFTALIGAAYSGHPAVVRRLLLAGARHTARSASGKTALQVAKEKGNTECVQVLTYATVLLTLIAAAYLTLTALVVYAFSFLWRLFSEQGRRGRPHRLRRTARERAMALLFSDMTALSGWCFRAHLLFAFLPCVVWGWANTLLRTLVGVVRPLDARAAEPARGQRRR